MMRAALILCAALALAGCSSMLQYPPVPSSTPAAQPTTEPAPKPACPPFRAWSAADLKTLAGTLEAIPETSILMRMALDWRRYYGDAKACAGAQGKP